MTPKILAWAKGVRIRFPFQPGRILEVGSFDVNGSIRDAFPDSQEYVGTDMRAGPGVDQVINNRDLVSTFGPSSFDTVICCECLEHDLRFWDTVEQMRTILRPQGTLMITTPDLGFPYHGFPFDYWRFTEVAYVQVFFKDMEILDLVRLPGPTVAGLAKKREG